MPWHFNHLSIDEAFVRLQNIPYLKLGITSRADWVANILLFIPLAFFWNIRLSFQKQFLVRLFSAIFVLIASIFLCVSIEFTQIFFPPRTVSLNDIIAETLGAIIGVVASWLFGGKFIQWLEVRSSKRVDSEFYLQIYLGSLFLYNVLPLDLTLSPVEFYHKWHEGRIILLPFAGLKGNIFQDVYDVFVDIVLWVPAPWFWLKKLRLNPGQLLMRVFIAALAIEFFQLFVYSRVTDVTNVLLAVVGGGVGVGLLNLFGKGPVTAEYGKALKITIENFLVFFIFYFFWGGIIIAVFWYPYDFRFGYSDFSSLFDRFFTLPFQAYYFGTEYRAITEVLHKTLFLMPIGAASGMIVQQTKNRSQVGPLAFVLICFWPSVVEFGQLFLPNKNSDVTDFILETLGGYIGFGLSRRFFISGARQFETAQRGDYPSASYMQNNSQHISGRNMQAMGWIFGIVSGIFIFSVLYFASQSESLPYNFRELFSSKYPALSSLGITLLLYWCFAFPLLFLLDMVSKNKMQALSLIKVLVVHCLGAWMLVRFIIPVESIHDVVGSPILPIPDELEIGGRFLALFGIFSLMTLGAGQYALMSVIRSREFKRIFFLGGLGLAPLLLLLFWIIVVNAATDNLTELLDNGGYSFFIINLLLYFILFSCLGTFVALTVVKKIGNVLLLLFLTLASLPVGYQLVGWGTEKFIVKYNMIFSAMQFLLSADRQSLVGEDDLKFRFFIMHIGLILIVSLTQVPILMIYNNTLKKYSNKMAF